MTTRYPKKVHGVFYDSILALRTTQTSEDLNPLTLHPNASYPGCYGTHIELSVKTNPFIEISKRKINLYTANKTTFYFETSLEALCKEAFGEASLRLKRRINTETESYLSLSTANTKYAERSIMGVYIQSDADRTAYQLEDAFVRVTNRNILKEYKTMIQNQFGFESLCTMDIPSGKMAFESPFFRKIFAFCKKENVCCFGGSLYNKNKPNKSTWNGEGHQWTISYVPK